MLLKCVSLSGDELLRCSDMTSTALVSEVQFRIWQTVRVPVLRQYLEHRGKRLQPTCTLAAASVEDGATLTLVTTSFLILTSCAHRIQLWNSEGVCVRSFQGHRSDVSHVGCSPDGRVVLSLDDQGILFLWDACSGAALHRIDQSTGETHYVDSACFSPSGEHVLTTMRSLLGSIWNVATGACTRAFMEPHEGPFLFSPNSACVLSVDRSSSSKVRNNIKFYEIETGKCSREFESGNGEITCVAFSSDGLFMLTGAGGVVDIWDLQIGECVQECGGHSGDVRSAAFSPDGALVLTAGDDGVAMISSRTTGATILEIDCGSVDAADGETDDEDLTMDRGLLSAAFSPDGLYVLTESEHGCTQVWCASTGDLLKTLADEGCYGAEFSYNSAWLLTCDKGRANVWDIMSRECILKVGCSIAHAAFSP